MARAKRKPRGGEWTEKYGCDGRPPILKTVHGISDPETKARAVVKRNTNHCTLCRLHCQGHLRSAVESRQLADIRLAAAEKLQDDHALSGQIFIKSTLGALGGGSIAAGPAEIAQMRIDADRRKHEALRAVGTSARFLLENIVLNDWTLDQASKIMRCKKNAVLPALRVALDALVQFYGMAPRAGGAIRGGDAQPLHPYQDGPRARV